MAPNSPPLRRITRASLARFSYLATQPETSTTPDIEDIIPSKKRKRASLPPPKKATRAFKTEVVKQESEHFEIDTKEPNTVPSPRRARKPARHVTDPSTGSKTTQPPSDWQELYDAAKIMRLPGGAAANAAVDTMGCERLADVSAAPRDQRFQTLVALMLSSQTKDTTNAVAMKRLKTELPPHKPGVPAGLTLENIIAVDPAKLNELIWAVGFHNNKTKYLKQAAIICRDEWDGDIPDTIEGLVALPGVGPKMAHLCLPTAWGRVEGIGVDVHVHRITNLWGWHTTKTPEQTRASLESWLPRDKWHEINWLLVGLGQTVCAPVGRKCGDCELGLSGMCKAADKAKVAQGRRDRKEAAKLEDGATVIEATTKVEAVRVKMEDV